ncbi:squamosa promoter-binding-like protein 13 [Hibiscus syriacus]|uniref:Squamosa promoter-binding-like protein 13 n=1 Tax=Hibiscus syriacus TaxID=106335 RepID=A0A6A3BTZ5_HIBSY|nr:squamosa promoter-binding-like protein 13 [Hibiscus syriacus]
MNGEELTEQETALYDRQVRVWGADAQRRLSKSHILVYGMKGLLRSIVREFLDIADENLYNGKTLAEVCCDSLKEFNPMVHVSVEKSDISTFGLEFLKILMMWSSVAALEKKKKLEETIECRLEYPSFEDATAVPWKALPKRVSKLYFAMRVIEQFEDIEGNPGQTSSADLPGVPKLRKELCETNSVNESQIPEALLERLLIGTSEYPPVCAIIGGILGQR